MAVLCGMSTIQYSARSARSYIIYCSSPFKHVAVLTILRLDRRRYDMACRVTRARASDVAGNLETFLVRTWHNGYRVLDFESTGREFKSYLGKAA